MQLNNEELINFFCGLFAEEQEADEIKRGIRDDLKSYAENHEINPKAMTAAYSLYKKYKGGKSSAAECEDLSELSGIVEAYFATGEEEE